MQTSKPTSRVKLFVIWVVCLLGVSFAELFAQSPPAGNQGVQFTATDSLIFSVIGQRIAMIYGNSGVKHKSGELTAGVITLDLDKTTMSAFTSTPDDTLSEPVLIREGDDIRSRRIIYNYVTEKGKFEVARVKVEGGNVIGDQVKKTASHVIFIRDGMYSTCDLYHPHFFLIANRMKIVDEEEVFFTSARLFILDIPYPFVFPFGYIPSKMKRKRSGLLEPTYAFQDQNRRGLGLQNFGWFQHFNDHLATTLSTDLFTSGTFFIQNRTEYNKTGSFRGTTVLSYSRDQGLEPTDPDFSKNTQKQLMWQHNQTISPFASFNMDINLRTSQYYTQNSYNIDDRAQTSTSSRIGYNYRHPEGIYTFGANVQQSQDFFRNTAQLSGPSMNFSLRRQTPFTPRVRRPRERIHETLSIGYNNRFNSRYNFTPLADANKSISWIDAFLDPAKYREATGRNDHIAYGFIQTADASMKLIPGNYFNVTGSARMNEYWYPESVRKEFDTDQNRVITNREKGFNAGRDFSTSITMSTTFFGIMARQIGTLEGFRHTVRPSVSYSWRPDFSKEVWGYYRTVPTDTLGNTQSYSKFEGAIFGGPGAGRQKSLNVSIGNVFEAKRVRRDSTGERKEQIIRIIDNLNASASYNFAATSFKLSDMNVTMNSSVIRNISLNANATFNFYDTDTLGRVVDRYLWDNDKGFARLTRFNARASTQFRQGQRGGFSQRAGRVYYPKTYDPFYQGEFDGYDEIFNSEPIEKIDVAWSFSLSFNYSWQYVNKDIQNRTAILNAQSIQARITPEWQVGTSIGYDFIRKDLTPSQFNITRNLHCWDLSFVWNPFGQFQYYLFRLTVRDSQIQSLFQKLPGLNNLERSSSPINRSRFY